MTERVDFDSLDAERIDPDELTLLLQNSGWSHRGGRDGLYSRWVAPEARVDPRGPDSLLVPLDRTRADFADLMDDAIAVLRDLAQYRREWVLPIVKHLIAVPGDEIKFRKSVSTVRGAISWPIGEELYSSARGALLAGAKSRMSRQAYFGQKNGRFAHRFLESVLMGQTEEGSYVVTAFAPPTQEFPEKTPKPGEEALPTVASYTGREIVEPMLGALEATQAAVDHYQRTNSLSGFEESVRAGVSREMTDAVLGMVRDAESAEITVEWSPQVPILDGSAPQSKTLTFSGGIAPLLERASLKLSTTTPSTWVTVSGWVTVVARPKRRESGIVRLNVQSGSKASSIQVRLTEDQFEVAAGAIAHGQALTVSGRQEKEGNRYWLYDADDVEAITLAPKQRRSRTNSDNQDPLPTAP